MSSSSNISQSAYSPSENSEPVTPQNTPQNRIPNFDQSLNHGDFGHSIEQSLKSAQKEMHQKRIQLLRKELDYLKSTEWKFEYDKGFMHFFTKDDVDDTEKESYLAEQLLELEYHEENIEHITETNGVVEIPKNTVCIERTGVITYYGENYVLIDGMLYFDISACTLNLSENDKVLYLAYKDSNDSIIIVRILQNLGVSWGDEDEIEEINFEVFEHVLVGEVDDREGRLVYIKESDLKFNLDNVEGTFIPIKGDWLEMRCKVQQNEEKLTDISMKQVLEVISFKALRTKVKHAAVTQWSGEFGICDRNIYFSKDCLQDMIQIKIGTKVIVEAIESCQEMCTWRALKMLVTENNIQQEESNNGLNNNEISLDVEEEKKIFMTHPIIFESLNINQSETKVINITNNSCDTYVINKWIMLSKRKDSQIRIKPFIASPTKLYPGKTMTLTIICEPKFLGCARECLVILFRGFQLKRFIEIDIINDNISDNNKCTHLENKSIYTKITNLKRIRNNRDGILVPGVRPVKPPAFISERLGSFPIPEKIWSTILGDSNQTAYSNDYDKIIERIETNLPCLCQDLNITNYLDRWHTLLFMEEVQENINMRIYDIDKVFLIRCQEYLGIEIKGLCEKRPSLVLGDRVVVKSIWNPNSSQYEGFIHAIKGDLVVMKFNQQFHESYDGGEVSAEFHFSRTTYRRAHQAINSALTKLGPDVLFPRRVMLRQSQVSAEKIKCIKWFNGKLNDGQKCAITNILSGEIRPLPYVIFGPPGTGKTITVIETVLQILTMMPESRILVATPSNSAANLVTERLILYNNSFSGSIVRLIANYLVDSINIPDEIKPFCATLDIAREDTWKSRYNVNKNNMNLNCSKTFIGRHRVTIGTCHCLGSLHQLGLPKGHFTHIIVDEAGQATEPEIMIPMSLIDKENGQIILAGDPKQLGPVIMSKYCIEFGMTESFLCRLLESFPYQKDYASFQKGFDNRLLTRLSDNYRSVKEVLKLPSEMFYDASLVAKVDYTMPWTAKFVEATCDIFDIHQERSGGIFVYGIKGCNIRAQDSPSWLNPHEASMVALVACKLYKKHITADEIGIITPYVAQIKHLKLIFDSMGLEQPKIGTVEEFQGQERPIILVTTVRSADSQLKEDLRHSLGFVQNPKRLNVIITRAQVSAIIFCNPHLLSKDPLWNSVITYAVQKDKYMGCDLPDNLQKLQL